MKLTVSHRDQFGELSASVEIPESVALSAGAVKEYGDSLTEVVIGSLEPPEDPHEGFGFPDGFRPINN